MKINKKHLSLLIAILFISLVLVSCTDNNSAKVTSESVEKGMESQKSEEKYIQDEIKDKNENTDFDTNVKTEDKVNDSSKNKSDSKNDIDVSKENKDSSDASDSNNHENKSNNDSLSSTKPSTNSNIPEKKKVWVDPVYEEVTTPAVTEERTVVKCKCGEILPDAVAWQTHRPQPCDGLHDTRTYLTETIVIKPAESKKVLVKDGYWKEVN